MGFDELENQDELSSSQGHVTVLMEYTVRHKPESDMFRPNIECLLSLDSPTPYYPVLSVPSRLNTAKCKVTESFIHVRQ